MRLEVSQGHEGFDVRYGILLVFYSNFVPKIFKFEKCRDLEIMVRGHSRSLKVISFDKLGMIFY